MLLAAFPVALAVGCGGGTKATNTPKTTTHKNTPTAQTVDYHANEHCQPSLAFAYSAQGFTCVNGRLRHKSHHAPPPTIHHHSHTSTAAPQGY
jgi:hypothetical protein